MFRSSELVKGIEHCCKSFVERAEGALAGVSVYIGKQYILTYFGVLSCYVFCLEVVGDGWCIAKALKLLQMSMR